MIPIVIVVSFIVYALMDLAPGTVIDAFVTDSMTQEDIAALKAKYDLDKPMIYRYGKYMLNLVHGDLGVSDHTRISVWDTYMSRLPNTLLLAFASLVFGAVISIPLGIIAARRAGSLVDNSVTLLTLFGISMPGFWLGLLLLLFFSLQLGWLPGGGNREGFRSLILPTVCSGFILLASATRQTRSSMLEVLNADFLRTARAKGVPEGVVIRKHALGNAWIPILTTIGNTLCMAIAGSAVIESVFAWNGVGREIVNAVAARDVTMALGCVIMTTFLYVLIQLVVDLLYSFVDPKIKSQYASKKKRNIRIKTDTANNAIAASDETATSVSPEPTATVPGMLCDNTQNEQDRIDIDKPTEFETESRVYSASAAYKAENEKAATGEREAFSNSVQSFAPVKEHGTGTVNTTGAALNADTSVLATKKYRKRSQLGEIFHRILKNKGATVGLIILAVIIVLFIVSLFIKFESVTASHAKDRFSPPSWQYPFGTDNMGRNMLLRVIYGTRYSLAIGFGVVAIATFIGVILGSVAGFYGGQIDNIIMRFSDVLASIPGLLFSMVIVTALGQSLMTAIFAVGVTAAPAFIRITRASVLTIKGSEFIEASRAIGFSNLRIIFSQVLPNGLSPIIVTITTNLGMAIMIVATLSYLGFGVPVPHPEWGALISAGREYARSASWLMTFPGLAIMAIVLSFNLLGDGLRDALDPKMKR